MSHGCSRMEHGCGGDEWADAQFVLEAWGDALAKTQRRKGAGLQPEGFETPGRRGGRHNPHSGGERFGWTWEGAIWYKTAHGRSLKWAARLRVGAGIFLRDKNDEFDDQLGEIGRVAKRVGGLF